MSQRLQHILLDEILEISAGFTESVASTDDDSDTKTLAEKMVECGVTSDDIPPMFTGTEFDICLALNTIDCFSLDERYVIATGAFLIRSPRDEDPRLNFAKIAVAFKTTASDGFDITLLTHLDLGHEWNGRMIYIPDGILSDLEDTYLESQLKLRKAGRNEFKKNRHFYPLLVQFGLEALSDTDADEIQARLFDIGDE